MRTTLPFLALFAIAADFRDVDPNVFPKDDPRAKDLPKMLAADAQRRLQEASLRESKAFAAVTTKAEWEKFRDVRIKALRESLGEFPVVPKEMRLKVTRELEGDGYRIQNLVYETRPGLWVNANLYLPTKPPEKMPGIIISHSHHTPNTQGELQDMGMTWARSGVAVLVPEHLGHGERRQHDFNTEKDFDKPFRVSRQDYYFRYNSALQLSAAGESLMGWMVWDLMRGVDVLLKQPGIDKDRIILLGAVAGGGDSAGVTAALDARISCVVPFNFGGWQPESSANANPDRDFPWFGEGYWETTRGLRNGARDGFAHYVIVGSVAPRKVIYAHEFAWDEKLDPVWLRLQKIFGLYDAKDSLRVTHGRGSVKGQAGPENTHCTHIGATHRKMIYPALKDWFGMPIPEEYSKRRPADELMCWTEEARKELQPKKLHEVCKRLVEDRGSESLKCTDMTPAQKVLEEFHDHWRECLGNIDPPANPKLIEGKKEDVPGGTLARFALEVEPGIIVPLLLIEPKDAKGKMPIVVMVSSSGKQAILKERGEAIAAFLKAGCAVCLPDVRGTGETRPGDGSPGRTNSRTSISQTEQILGTTLIGSQLRDLRAVANWLQGRPEIDRKALAAWGDSFARPNAPEAKLAVPLDAGEFPQISEPNGALLATLFTFLNGEKVIYTRGGLLELATMQDSPYIYLPHEAIIPGIVAKDWLAFDMIWALAASWKHEAVIDARNRPMGDKPMSPADAAAWVIEQLRKK
jgi:cephalosporin-C deacetylase-like acetyl esterase